MTDPDWFARDHETKRHAYRCGFIFGAVVGALVMGMALSAFWLAVTR